MLRSLFEELDELIATLLEWASAMEEAERQDQEVDASGEDVAMTPKSESVKDRVPFTISLPGTTVRINLSVLTFG